MPQSLELTRQELTQVLLSNTHPELKLSGNKYVIFSDMHLGNGGPSDDFVRNEWIVVDRLDYYRKNNFKLILLGDIEDFWQFKPDETRKRYNDSVYKKIREFGDENVFRVFGNHDIEWSKKETDCEGDKTDPLFNDGREFGSAKEAIKLVNDEGKTIILLMHGQQGSIESEIFAWLSKPFVWIYGKTLERLFGVHHFSSEPNTDIDSNYEQVCYKVALEKKVIIIVGHSHYAIFASKCHANELQRQVNKYQLEIKSTKDKNDKKELRKKLDPILIELRAEKARKREITPTDPNSEPKPCYFNSGCCLYTYGITCIEIEDDNIRLLKWNAGLVPEDYGQGKISEFYNSIK